MQTKNSVNIVLLILSYLVVLHVGDISHQIASIILLAGIFLYSGIFDFLFSKKNIIATILLSIALIAFLYKAVPSIPFFYNNFDPGTIAFLTILPFLIHFNRQETARITLFIFFLIPLMVFTKNEGVAETAAIATYLCIGLIAVRSDTI